MVDETEGNVHSGARPPWLEAGTDDGDAAVESLSIIGPTADDLQKHCMSFVFKVLLPHVHVQYTGCMYQRDGKAGFFKILLLDLYCDIT